MKSLFMAMAIALITITASSTVFACPKGEHPHGVPAHTIREAGARMISKIAIPVVLLLCFSTSALAKATLNIDGNSLYHGYQLYEKGFDYLSVQDEQTAVMYMSFVAGVAGALSQENIICGECNHRAGWPIS